MTEETGKSGYGMGFALTVVALALGIGGTATGAVTPPDRPTDPASRTTVAEKLAKCRGISNPAKRRICVLKAKGKTSTVLVLDNFFEPNTLEVNRYDKVSWSWRDSVFGEGHNVFLTSRPRGVDQRDFLSTVQYGPAGRFTRTLEKSGSYLFICTLHAGMELRVKVRR